MKIFVDLGKQVPPFKKFTFFCTDWDRFEMFSGEQAWSTIDDFIADYDGDNNIDRYLVLIPEGWEK
jgi:hypothetical protein